MKNVNYSMLTSKLLGRRQRKMSPVCTKFLRCIERNCDVSALKVDLSNGNGLSSLNGLFTNKWIANALQWKEYLGLYMVFTFLAVFIDRATPFVKEAADTQEYFSYSKLERNVVYREYFLCLIFPVLNYYQTK